MPGPTPAAAGRGPSAVPRRLAALVVALLAALAVLALWWVFVTTAPGQRVDEIALEGSTIGRWRLADGAHHVLQVVSVPFLVLVILAGVAVAALRRQWFLACAVPLTVGGANLTTQVLKYQLLDRPDLGISAAHGNSLPSGHTTVAASVAAVAVLVVPPRWRWAAALAGWGYAGGTGLATMIGGWHRASDVAAGLLVGLCWAALALAVVGPWTEPGPADGSLARDPAGRTPAAGRATNGLGATADPGTAGASANRATSVLLAMVVAFAGLVAALALMVTWLGAGGAADQGRGALLLAYLGASAGVAAVTCLAALVLLRLGGPLEDRGARRRDAAAVR